jgi:hypothetical protein
MTRPRAARSPASCARPTRPYGDAARDPTIATDGALSASIRRASTDRRRIGDGRQRDGVRGSLHAIGVIAPPRAVRIARPRRAQRRRFTGS